MSRRVRALVDDCEGFAAPLMDRARPGKHAGEIQPVELGVAVISVVHCVGIVEFAVVFAAFAMRMTAGVFAVPGR
jgi:hypothetical protein